jgi:hypothetical protein
MSAQQLFSDAQALTTTAASTNHIDLGATGTVLGAPAALTRDIAKGEPIPIVVKMDVAAGGTSPTITVSVQVDDNSSFSSATTVLTTDSKSGGAAGDEIYIPVYLPEGTNERYLRLNYTLGGTSPTYTVTAGVVKGRNSNYTVPGA